MCVIEWDMFITCMTTKGLSAALQKWENSITNFSILALWLLSILLKMMCMNINKLRKAGGWMIRGGWLLFDHCKKKVENTYVVVTANLQDFCNSVSLSVGTFMLQPLGASASELSWETLLCTRAQIAPCPSGSSVWCQKDTVICLSSFQPYLVLGNCPKLKWFH